MKRKDNGNCWQQLFGQRWKELWVQGGKVFGPCAAAGTERHNISRASWGPSKNEEACAKLIQFLDYKSLYLIIRDPLADGRKSLQRLREYYAGKGKPWVISLYAEVTLLQKANHESVTDLIVDAETAITALRNYGDTLSDGLLIAMGWRTLFDKGIWMLLETNLLKQLWTHAVMRAAVVRNRCFNRRVGKTPYHVPTGRKSD